MAASHHTGRQEHALLAGLSIWLYPAWKRHLAARLREDSEMLETALGPVECRRGSHEPPLVVGVHGSPGGHDQIPAVFPGFPGVGFPLMSWSRPGYLGTSLALGRSFEDQADVLAALLDTLHLGQVALFAFSGGGPVAVHFAARHPDRVWALILESAVTHRLPSPSVWVFDSLFGNWLLNLVAQVRVRTAFARLLPTASQLEAETARHLLERALRDERRQEVLHGLLRSASPAALRHAGLRNDSDRIQNLEPLPFASVLAPTLILHGAQDSEVPLECAERAARLIRRAELVRVPAGLHLLSLADNADAITSRRIEFLSRHAPPRPSTRLSPLNTP